MKRLLSQIKKEERMITEVKCQKRQAAQQYGIYFWLVEKIHFPGGFTDAEESMPEM